MIRKLLASRVFWRVLVTAAVVVVAEALVVGALVGDELDVERAAEHAERARGEARLLALAVQPALVAWTGARERTAGPGGTAHGDPAGGARGAAPATDVAGADATGAEARGEDPAGEIAALAERAAAELPGRRITIIAADGTVLADTHESPDVMDDHRRRPEILALGSAVTRFSQTLQREMVYTAAPVEVGEQLLGYARVARARADLEALPSRGASVMPLAVLGALGAAVVLALVLGPQLTSPLGRIGRALAALAGGARQVRLTVRGGNEVAALAHGVNELARRLDERIEGLEQVNLQHRAVLASMEEGVVAVDADQRVVLINEAAGELLLADHRIDPRGRSLVEITRVPEVVAAVTRCLEEGVKVSEEVRMQRGQHALDVAVSVVPLGGDARGEVGCVTVLHDLTDVRRLETIRRDFVANVSHELKTPLTSIKGFVETVLDDPQMPPEQRAAFLTRALDNADRLAAIVADLLDLARIESREAERELFGPLDLADVVRRAAQTKRAAADEKSIVLDVDTGEGPLPFFGDETVLETAVANLVENAVRYSPARSSVRVRLRSTAAAIVIEVADDGPGIPVHEQQRIFERFYRVDKDRSRHLGGTGLGLSIVKHAVTAHGGEVSVESKVGVGSTFRIHLPPRAA